MTLQERQQAFQLRYEALCEETGFRLMSATIVAQGGIRQLVDPIVAEVPGWEPPLVDDTAQADEKK